jgi:hypothetical protein
VAKKARPSLSWIELLETPACLSLERVEDCDAPDLVDRRRDLETGALYGRRLRTSGPAPGVPQRPASGASTSIEIREVRLAESHADTIAPMSNLHAHLNELAQSFADSILDVIRGASLQELASPGERVGNGRDAARRVAAPPPAPQGRPRGTGRLPRRSAEDIAPSSRSSRS